VISVRNWTDLDEKESLAAFALRLRNQGR